MSKTLWNLSIIGDTLFALSMCTTTSPKLVYAGHCSRLAHCGDPYYVQHAMRYYSLADA